jgi:PHO85 cyclin-1
MACTRHRVFLATLIVAAKYLNDSSPKNGHWAHYAAFFEVSEINLMERQLIYLMDYDLRFDEKEAYTHFAYFMSTRSPQETRAAAVRVVNKASQARLKAQLPPTPPHDAVTPATPASVPSSVHGLVKRISSAYLKVHSTGSHASQQSRLCSPASSTLSIAGTSDASEMDSLTEDDSSSLSSDTPCDTQERTCDVERTRSKKFTLMPVPPHAYRQARISSTSSNATIRSDEQNSVIRTRHQNSPSTQTTPLPSPVKCTGLDISKSTSQLGSGLRSSSSHLVFGETRSRMSLSSSMTSDMRDLPSSTTLPSMSRQESSSSNSSSGSSFLSRMWGVATRGGQDKGGKMEHLPINVVEHETQYSHGTSAFRRLAHSRSSFFRGGSQSEYNV